MHSNYSHSIKYSVVTNAGDDSKNFPRSQVSYLGKTADTAMVWPYGFGGLAPNGALCVTFCANGHEENRISIPTSPDKRIKNLQPGEVYFSNLLTGTYIMQKANGDIDIVSKGGENISLSKDKNENIQGKLNLNVQGDVTLNVQGKVSINCNEIDLGFGGQPIARLGDQVQVNTSTGMGTITSASTKNKSA